MTIVGVFKKFKPRHAKRSSSVGTVDFRKFRSQSGPLISPPPWVTHSNQLEVPSPQRSPRLAAQQHPDGMDGPEMFSSEWVIDLSNIDMDSQPLARGGFAEVLRDVNYRLEC